MSEKYSKYAYMGDEKMEKEKENPRDNLGPVEKAIYKMLIFTGLLRH